MYGVQPLLVIYSLSFTIAATYYLVSRDQRMRVKLERAIGLTDAAESAEDLKHALYTQRLFAVHWELAAMIGGITAYMR
jgi:hypothetical protein